jgi:hypothetical protein
MPILLPNTTEPKGKIWLPDSALREKRWECPFCDCVIYGERVDQKIVRHMDKHEDDIGAEALERREEPLVANSDHEQVKWLREKAQRERDTTVKGVN